MMKRLIDFFPDLLNEASAGDEAKKRGLKSIGFGRYVDPSNPSKVVAKSKNGKLVSVGQTAPSHMKGKDAARFNKRARAFDDDDIGGAVSQVRDIEKRNSVGGKPTAAEKRKYARNWDWAKKQADKEEDEKYLKSLDDRPAAAKPTAAEKRKYARNWDWAKKQADKEESDYSDRASGAEKRARGATAERRGPDREENQKSLNKRQGNTLRKIFGKGVGLRKVVTANGQHQMWWDIEDLSQSPSKGLSGAFMSGKGQQWQRNKLAKVKNAIASDPALKGWAPVFQQDPHGGVNLVMVKEANESNESNERSATVGKLSKMTVAKLRKRQRIIDAQITKAFDKKDEKAMKTLQAARQVTDDALYKKEFGNR